MHVNIDGAAADNDDDTDLVVLFVLLFVNHDLCFIMMICIGDLSILEQDVISRSTEFNIMFGDTNIRFEPNAHWMVHE